jgi:hypothetical protein
MGDEVTDPQLLSQLNGAEGTQAVTDPALLAQLNSNAAPATTPAPSTPQYQPGGFWSNAAAGAKKVYTNDIPLGISQIYSSLFEPGIGPQLSQQAQAARQYYAPLMSTWGGKAGTMGAYAPLSLVPGANSVAGAAALGGITGALQPTTQNDSRLINTALGGALGLGGKVAGDTLSSWVTNRAAQPFLGWNQRTGNAAAASAAGSEARQLDQGAISDASDRFTRIFSNARSPDVSVPLTESAGSGVAGSIYSASSGLNQSSRTAFTGNEQVQDIMSLLRSGTGTAKQLGDISSKLNTEAASQMSSKGGDRALGQALYAVKDKVDGLIGNSIQDPAQRAEYFAALPQYRTFTTLTNRPTLLNSATGDVNLNNLGKYLQRYDKAGYTRGGNTTPLYQAARYGQASGIGSRPPPPILQPFKWGAYHLINNPVAGAAAGTVSRLGAPVSPQMQAILGRSYLTNPLLAQQ